MYMFYTYLKLQGSQTEIRKGERKMAFYTYLKLQGSQTSIADYFLLRSVLHLSEITRFSNLNRPDTNFKTVLHLSEITRFSNFFL